MCDCTTGNRYKIEQKGLEVLCLEKEKGQPLFFYLKEATEDLRVCLSENWIVLETCMEVQTPCQDSPKSCHDSPKSFHD